MIVRTARTSLSIRIVTASMLVVATGCLVGGLFDRNLLLIGFALGITVFLCYLLAPAAYEVDNGCLTVLRHAGRRCFGPVVSCARLTEPLPFTIRLLGNGGVFAGVGIFWNRPLGVFRAYVTSASWRDTLQVQTRRGKVLVTPRDPVAFAVAIAEQCLKAKR